MGKVKKHIIKVWGDFGCFTRPEFKTERFSYPCPTPSAARGIFDSIFCKAYNRNTKVAEFYWQIDRIELLSYPSYIALRRNEVSHTSVSEATIHRWQQSPDQIKPIMSDECRQQRQTMALRNPMFRIHAHIVARSGFEAQIKSFDDQFYRRATHGKFFSMPNFGCREFPAFFDYVEDVEKEANVIDFSQDIGFMLYDVFDLRRVNNEFAKPFVSVFRAEIKAGILDIPDYCDSKVLKPEVSYAA